MNDKWFLNAGQVLMAVAKDGSENMSCLVHGPIKTVADCVPKLADSIDQYEQFQIVSLVPGELTEDVSEQFEGHWISECWDGEHPDYTTYPGFVDPSVLADQSRAFQSMKQQGVA